MSLPELFANPFFTQLAEACTSNATTITVQKAAPEALQKEGQFRVLLGAAEYALVTGGFTSNGKTWTVTRGVESTAAAHAQGEEVLHLLTAGSLGSQSDAAAGVPSLRTLGTGAQQAAPGTMKAEAEAGAEAIAEAVAAAGLAVEKGRAEGVEGTLTSNLVAEVTRAEAAEATKASITALSAEVSRAEAAEALLIPASELGAANGPGSLDGTGRQPISQSPLSVVSSNADPAAAGQVAVSVGSGSNALLWQSKTVVDARDVGVIHQDSQVATTGGMPSGSKSLSITGGFPGTAAGMYVQIQGAGAGGAPLLTKIVSVAAGVATTEAANASGSAVSNAYVVWGHDDRPGVRQAVDAAEAIIAATGAGVVLEMPPGRLFYATGENSGTALEVISGVGIDPGLADLLHIRGGGRDGVTTITLSMAAVNAFWLRRPYANGVSPKAGDATNAAGDFSTFQNIYLSDFDVDCNHVPGQQHLVIGSMPANGTNQTLQNTKNCAVRRVKSYNAPEDATGATCSPGHVRYCNASHASASGTENRQENVWVEDCDFYGGGGGALVCALGVSLVEGANCYHNNIYMRRCTHIVATIPTATGPQTSFYVCGVGFGDYFEMEALFSENISDDGLEIGAMQRGIVRNVEIVNAYQDGFDLRITHPLKDVGSAKIKFEDIRIKVTSALLKAGGTPLAQPFAIISDLNASAETLPHGTYVFEDLDYWIDGASVTKLQASEIKAVWRIITLYQKNVTRFELIRPRIRITNLALDHTTEGFTIVGYDTEILTGANTAYRIRDARFEIPSSTVTGNKNLVIYPLLVSGGGGASVLNADIDGFEVAIAAINFTALTGNITCMSLGSAGGAGTVSGRCRNLKIIEPTGATGGSFNLVNIGEKCTITGFVFDDYDFSGATFPAAEFKMSEAGTNGAHVVIGNGVTGGEASTGNGKWVGHKAVTAAVTLDASMRDVAVTSTGTAYTVTIPPSANFPIGEDIVFKDQGGGAAANNITLGRSSTDLIDGAVSLVLKESFQHVRLRNRGSHVWSVVG